MVEPRKACEGMWMLVGGLGMISMALAVGAKRPCWVLKALC